MVHRFASMGGVAERVLSRATVMDILGDDDCPGFILKTTCSRLLKAFFWFVWLVLICFSVFHFCQGRRDWIIWLNFICIALAPLLFSSVSRSEVAFSKTGIDLSMRTLCWSCVEDVTVEEKRRKVLLHLDDGTVHILYARRGTTHAMYETVIEYCHRMIALSRAR